MHKLYLLRHAPWSEKNYSFEAGSESKFTPLAEALLTENPNATRAGIASSPLNRAYRTAEKISTVLRDKAKEHKREITLGIPPNIFQPIGLGHYENHGYGNHPLPCFELCDSLTEDFSPLQTAGGYPQLKRWIQENIQPKYGREYKELEAQYEQFKNFCMGIGADEDFMKQLEDQKSRLDKILMNKPKGDAREYMRSFINRGRKVEPILRLIAAIQPCLDLGILLTHLEFLEQGPKQIAESLGFRYTGTSTEPLEGAVIDFEGKSIKKFAFKTESRYVAS